MKMKRRIEAAYDDGTTVWVEEWSSGTDLGSLDDASSADAISELRLPDGEAVNRSPDGTLVAVSTGRKLTPRA